MALFQTSVLNKYLKTLDSSQVNAAWEVYTAHFHNPTIQETIRAHKEEQYQSGFLTDLFVKVLGYTLSPQPDYNLTTEFRNVSNAKKADGAILKDNKAIAVIELKGTNTVDLSKIQAQAFGYLNNQPDAVYVITSNFEKLRFYIEKANEFEAFNLFTLTRERFELLYLCLHKDHILKDLPQTIKNESIHKEEEITKKLYKDYSNFRHELFDDIQQNNSDHDPMVLFKKTQKLLDRFLFILFAEDRQLLPPNSIHEIVDQWQKLKGLDAYTPLYRRFVKYFGYLNAGYKGTKHDIFAYNGGLFKPDSLLDTITIGDEVLHKYTTRLSTYDFKSEVSVNVLGHIFEHSLTEIEEFQARIEGQELDKGKTKRKKDGVFYTPQYITQYIVENTVGKLCDEKKTELQLDETEYRKDRRGRTKKKLKELLTLLETYREWLIQLTICDPACGSGAFLNEALQFLMAEHGYIDELQTSLLGGGFEFPNVEKTILENNLYGVDINNESVEIAKLSLWLSTAAPNRKLSSLNNNIKCGNSLIDDSAVAGDKAFDWHKEFPEVFAKGGFDVVIGNPPYVRQEIFSDIKPYLESKYKSYVGTADLFTYFYEKGALIIKKNGLLSFITNDFNKTKSSTKLRKFLKETTNFISFDDFTEVDVFKGTTTYPVILTFSNAGSDSFSYCKFKQDDIFNLSLAFTQKRVDVNQSKMNDENWTFRSYAQVDLSAKLCRHENVRTVIDKCYYGIKTGLNEAFIIDNEQKKSIIENQPNDKKLVKAYLEGKDLKKWNIPSTSKNLILVKSKSTKERFGNLKDTELFDIMKKQHKGVMSHLLKYEEKAKKRYDKGEYWWELRNCAYYDLFEKPKIVFPNLQNSNKFSLDEKGRYINAPAVILPSGDKALLAILNSKVVWYFLNQICVVRSGGYIEVKPQYFEQIPIPTYDECAEPLMEYCDSQIDLTKRMQTSCSRFLKRIQSNLEVTKISKKLDAFYDHDFKTFLAELKKQKVKLSLKDQDEWEEYFTEYKTEINDIQAQIASTDEEIDRMVYDLYGLTEEEIRIVEEATA